MKESRVYDCSIVEFPRHHSDRRGNLSVVTGGVSVPFDVRRVYYIYDVPGGESRGAHAHKNLHQLIVAVSGSFIVTVGDGHMRRSFRLDRPYTGLYIVPGIWRTLDEFSSGAVCLVLASELYDADDYIRDYDEYLEYKGVIRREENDD